MKPISSRSGIAVTAFSALLTAACVTPPVEQVTTTVEQETNVSTAQTQRNKVDILFMVDNSPSMGAMQAQLQAQFPKFLDVFNTLAHPTDGTTPQYADLQIAVVTSDYGAGDVPGSGCDASPGGQKGAFQAIGASAASTCQAPTDAAYIKYAFSSTGSDVCNLPGGTCTADALNTQFTCAASVGAAGCGFEHQLESTYAALKATDSNHAGFLRSDAILAVVFVTNEDDSSSAPSVDFFNPSSSDYSKYGDYTTYRQTHFGVACGTPPKLTPEGDSGGALDNCEAAPNVSGNQLGGEYDVSRYIDLFTTPNALKADPTSDIILVGLDAPTTPFATILATDGTGNGQTGTATYATCPTLVQGKCIVALQHSCQNSANQAFFGDPPVRLDTVIKSAQLNDIENICGDDPSTAPDYSTALTTVAGLIVSQLKPSCLTAPIKTVTDTAAAAVTGSPVPAGQRPDCVVEDVLGTTITPIPYCGDNGGKTPCWEQTDNPSCSDVCQPASGAAAATLVRPTITIERGGVTPPSGTNASVSCNTVALANTDPCAACGVKTNSDGTCGSTTGSTADMSM